MTQSATIARATWRDYKELTKPNVVALMILTSVIGMCTVSYTHLTLPTTGHEC